MCSLEMKDRSEELIASESTMIAAQTYYDILEKIQHSNLNYYLQVSPFSAAISLKKSPAKDKSGRPLLPSPTLHASSNESELFHSQQKIELEMINVQKAYESITHQYEIACEKIKALEKQIIDSEEIYVVKAAKEDLRIQSMKEVHKNELLALELTLQVRDEAIASLETACEKAQTEANKLHKEFCDFKIKSADEKLDIKKAQKSEIKRLRKELENVTKEKTKLEGKLSACDSFIYKREDDPVETECTQDLNENQVVDSLCATPTENYEPKYHICKIVNPQCARCVQDNSDNIYDASSKPNNFQKPVLLTRKGFNYRPKYPFHKQQNWSLVGKCVHPKSCIVREPIPPPLPALTPLENDTSNYHTRFLNGSLNWGHACSDSSMCFHIDNVNYGCNNCVWIKWYGQLHGYPDIHPSSYQQYLVEEVNDDFTDDEESESPALTKSKTVLYKISKEWEDMMKEDKVNAKLWDQVKIKGASSKGELLDYIEEIFCCIICQDIVYQPVTIPCSHNVCLPCLEGSFFAGVFNCSSCGADLGKNYLTTNPRNVPLKKVLNAIFTGYEVGR